MASPQASSQDIAQKTAAIISRPNRPDVAQVLPGLFAWLTEHAYKVIVDLETAKYVAGQEVVPRAEMASKALDLVVVLGGDGTLIIGRQSDGARRCAFARREPGVAWISNGSAAGIALPHAGIDRAGAGRGGASLAHASPVAARKAGERRDGARQLSGVQRRSGE